MSNNNCDITEEQLSDLRNAFQLFDPKKDGVISRDKLSSVMKSLGQYPSKEEVEKMIKNVDKNGNNLIEFNEFVEMMSVYMKASKEPDDVVKEIFKLFDKNKNGIISRDELAYMMKSMGEKLSHSQIKQMMKFADLNRDGVIDFSEFTALMESVPYIKKSLERIASN